MGVTWSLFAALLSVCLCMCDYFCLVVSICVGCFDPIYCGRQPVFMHAPCAVCVCWPFGGGGGGGIHRGAGPYTSRHRNFVVVVAGRCT